MTSAIQTMQENLEAVVNGLTLNPTVEAVETRCETGYINARVIQTPGSCQTS